jgi:hypothetical protein
MVTIWASDYVLNTVGHVLFKHNILHHVLTKQDLPDSGKDYLNTTCSGFACFGGIIPQVGKTFPNASVEIEMMVTTPPTTDIFTTGIFGNFAGDLIYRARYGNGSVDDMFTTNMTVKIALNVSLENLVLKGKVDKLTYAISVIDSKVGPLSGGLLKLLFDFIVKAFLIPSLNKVGEKGIPIPNVDDVRFTNAKLNLETSALRIETDVAYVPKGDTLRFKSYRS